MKKSFCFLACILLYTSCLKNDFPSDLRISSLSSLSGSAFTVITMRGSNFKADPLLDTVKINGVVATVQSATTSSITFIVPFCNGSGNITISTPDATVSGPYFNYIKGPDVYVSGWGAVSTTNFKNILKYWKNGIEVWVTDSTYSAATSGGISVINNDVYILGRRDSGIYSVQKYWKNGIPLNISPGIIVNDAGLNAAVVANNQFWKSGSGLPYTLSGAATSVSIIGSDIYAAGGIVTPPPPGVSAAYTAYAAKFWKNAVLVPIQDLASTRTNSSWISSMAVSGTDVYLVGYNATGAAYWKNGIPTNLFTGSQNSYELTGVYAVGSDFYICGYSTFNSPSNEIAVYWKNGNPIKLSDGKKEEYAMGITVVGNDVYVCGYELFQTTNPTGIFRYAKVWKNGVPIILSNKGKWDYADGIFVKQ